MAWLKDHNPEASMRALAARLLDDPQRPAADVTQRHLGNMLSKAERGDAAWFFGVGAPWVPALARALELPEHEVRELLQSAPGVPADKISLFVFDEFPGLRHLDLDVEELPPGLPQPPRGEVWFSVGRDPIWWAVRTGTGAGLVRRALERDSAWVVLVGEDWAQVQDRLPRAGRVLLVLESSAGAPFEAPSLEDGLEQLWVLCPQPAPAAPATDDEGEAPRGWKAPYRGQDWLAELLGWVDERYQSGGGLDLVPFREALGESGSWLHALAGTFDEALELLALCDRVGTDTLLGDVADVRDHEARMVKVLEGWLRLYAPRLSGEAPAVAAQLKRGGAELLVQLEASRLLELLPVPLPWDRWQRLLPEPASDAVLGQEIAELARAGRLDEVKRLADRPRAPELLQGLVDLGLLLPREGGWLPGRPLIQVLLRQLVPLELRRRGWQGIGALLLDPTHSEDTLDWLCERARGAAGRNPAADPSDPSALLLQADPTDPRGAAALDGACRTLAVAALSGVAVPVATLARAVRVLDEAAVRPWPNALPLPALRLAERPKSEPERSGGWVHPGQAPAVDGLTGQGGWYLAVLALGRALHREGGSLPPGPLWPWGGELEPEGMALAWRMYERAALGMGAFPTAVAHGVGEDESGWIEDLALSLWEGLGLEGVRHHEADALAGELLVRAWTGEALEQDRLASALRLPVGLAPLERACARHGVELHAVLAWCWPHWLEWGWQSPPLSWASSNSAGVALAEQAARLWRALPPDCLRATHLGLLGQASEVHPLLPREIWARILELLLEDPNGSASRGLGDSWWQDIPPDLLLDAIEQGRLGVQYQGPGEVVWAALPVETLAVVGRLAAHGPPLAGPGPDPQPGSQLLGLALGAPDERCPELLDRVQRWLAAPEDWPGRPGDDRLLILLVRWVERRRPRWQDAWRLLDGLRRSGA